MNFFKYLLGKSDDYAKDLKLHISPNVFCSSIAELNPLGIKACIVYRKWVHYILTEVSQEFGGVLTEELAREIIDTLKQQILKAMQPMHIVNEMKHPQRRLY